MKVIMHADDLGTSEGVTDAIVRAHTHGCLDRTALVPNGAAFAYAVDRLGGHPGLAWTVHLNLLEGKPLLPAADVPALVGADGYFRHTLPSLWRLLRQSRGAAGQVRAELRAQLGKIRGAFPGNGPLAVDSHIHVHMVPQVFDAVLSLRDEAGIGTVRIPREPFFLSGEPLHDLRNVCSANLAKHLLLRRLSASALRKLEGTGLAHPDYFIGVLYTGCMTEAAVRRGIERVSRIDPGAEAEVLLHPGGARPDERRLWRETDPLADYYAHGNRTREAAVLASPGLKAYLDSVRKGA